MNFYIASHHYGMVEISHLAPCYAILDPHVGWAGSCVGRIVRSAAPALQRRVDPSRPKRP